MNKIIDLRGCIISLSGSLKCYKGEIDIVNQKDTLDKPKVSLDKTQHGGDCDIVLESLDNEAELKCNWLDTENEKLLVKLNDIDTIDKEAYVKGVTDELGYFRNLCAKEGDGHLNELHEDALNCLRVHGRIIAADELEILLCKEYLIKGFKKSFCLYDMESL